ncbi:MAG TPA: hypothetical protein VFM13_04475 [Gaiellaceae bacterium]|nr:hypothetical protein [Gaiellaceae bacterium]
MDRGPATDDFLDAYGRAFAAFDVEAVADMFAYPWQITSGADEAGVTIVPRREAWLPELERLVAAYRTIGVAAAEILERRTTELTPRLAQVVVRWALTDRAGARIYDFDAAYTLADLGDGLRITAIAHNETARLRAALTARRSGG